jgi:hypothetical protein
MMDPLQSALAKEITSRHGHSFAYEQAPLGITAEFSFESPNINLGVRNVCVCALIRYRKKFGPKDLHRPSDRSSPSSRSFFLLSITAILAMT